MDNKYYYNLYVITNGPNSRIYSIAMNAINTANTRVITSDPPFQDPLIEDFQDKELNALLVSQ